MTRVLADVNYDEVENDEGRYVDGSRVTCTKCGHSVEVFGDSDASLRRGAFMLREQCPRNESNFYEINIAGV